VTRRVDTGTLAALGTRLDGHLALAVLGSRFLPGARLPMYLAVGISGRRPVAFAAWSFVAVLLWTPALVWLTQMFGSSITTLLLGELSGVLRYLLSAIVLCTAWRLTVRVVAGLSSRT
jgi:membrane protein DedA with SNARE-associated domain